MAVTLSQLRTRARQAADMENSAFISDAELTSMVNASYLSLYNLLVTTFEDYFVTGPTTFTLSDSDAGVYALPSDFFKLRGLDYLLGSDYVTVYPFQWSRRNQLNRALRSTWTGQVELGYRILGTNLRIEPNDSATGTYRLYYIPACTPLSSDSDTLSTQITRSGWEEYIVIDVARKMRIKEESSVDALVSQLAVIKQDIMDSASDRDADQPQYINDVYAERNLGLWNGW